MALAKTAPFAASNCPYLNLGFAERGTTDETSIAKAVFVKK